MPQAPRDYPNAAAAAFRQLEVLREREQWQQADSPDRAAQAPSVTLGRGVDTGPGGVCFNCWSAGQGKQCAAHLRRQRTKVKRGQESVMVCGNWDLGTFAHASRRRRPLITAVAVRQGRCGASTGLRTCRSGLHGPTPH